MPEVTAAAPEIDEAPSKIDRFVAKYQQDHKHPVNHFLHLGMGWPMCAAAVILLPFKPFWSVGLVLGAYVLMFAGHFLFEGNKPTILKHPTTPFVMAWAVIRGLFQTTVRLFTGARAR